MIIKSLGMKPRNGGRPPKENKAKKERVLDFIPGIELICLKWKIWFLLRRRTTDEETRV